MTWLLDTNVVSELRSRRDPPVMAWFGARDADDMYLSVVTVQEIEVGIARKERADPTQGAVLRRWFTGDVLPAFGDRVVPLDLAVARMAARLLAAGPRPLADTWIAATALVHGMHVVTRNVADFATVPDLLTINPWEAG